MYRNTSELSTYTVHILIGRICAEGLKETGVESEWQPNSRIKKRQHTIDHPDTGSCLVLICGIHCLTLLWVHPLPYYRRPHSPTPHHPNQCANHLWRRPSAVSREISRFPLAWPVIYPDHKRMWFCHNRPLSYGSVKSPGVGTGAQNDAT